MTAILLRTILLDANLLLITLKYNKGCYIFYKILWVAVLKLLYNNIIMCVVLTVFVDGWVATKSFKKTHFSLIYFTQETFVVK